MTNPPSGYPGAQPPHEPTDWAATQQYPSQQQYTQQYPPQYASPQPPTEVYPQYSAPPTPPQHAPSTPWWRRWWVLALAGGVVGLIIGLAAGGGGSANTKTIAGPTVTHTLSVSTTVTQTVQPTQVIATHTKTVHVTYTPPPPPAPKSWSDGTYVVGTDIQPGVYKTNGQGEAPGCYWARLRSLNTQDIIDNGIVNGPTTIEVQSGDKALQLSGGCHWAKIG